MPSLMQRFVYDLTQQEKTEIGAIMFSVHMSGGMMSPTGSRVIGGFNPSQSDFDFVIWVPQTYHLNDWFLNEAPGWQNCRRNPLNPEYTCESNIVGVYRKGRLNMIIVSREEDFNKWMEATKLCIRLGVTTKAERVEVFESVLYNQTGGLLNALQNIRRTNESTTRPPVFRIVPPSSNIYEYS